jgi:hypothetical protein
MGWSAPDDAMTIERAVSRPAAAKIPTRKTEIKYLNRVDSKPLGPSRTQSIAETASIMPDAVQRQGSRPATMRRPSETKIL